MIYVFSSKLLGSKQLCSVAFSRDAIPTVQVRMGRLVARSTFIVYRGASGSFQFYNTICVFLRGCQDVQRQEPVAFP